ncbi:MAG: hypothetical protein M3Y84_05085, partial [Acidobacteriota bacterium]|nr:hypothetical protein [Acidobacteriota bacterium]
MNKRSEPASRAQFLVAFRFNRAVGIACLIVTLSSSPEAFSQRRTIKSSSATSVLTITTEPNAIVWIDEIRRGVT